MYAFYEQFNLNKIILQQSKVIILIWAICIKHLTENCTLSQISTIDIDFTKILWINLLTTGRCDYIMEP